MTRNLNISKNWRQYVFLYGMIANVQFVLLSFLAMVLYAGQFSFFEDPLSMLGFTAIEGKSNLLSFLIFNTSMFLVGISVALLFPTTLPFFNDDPIEKFFSTAGSIFAVFSGIAMCGAALTPGDINFDAHVAFAPFTFLFGLLMVAFFIIPFIRNENFPNKYAFILGLYTIFVVITIIFLYMGSAAYELEGTIIQIITQKIAIYTEVIVLLVLSYGAWNHQKNLDLR